MKIFLQFVLPVETCEASKISLASCASTRPTSLADNACKQILNSKQSRSRGVAEPWQPHRDPSSQATGHGSIFNPGLVVNWNFGIGVLPEVEKIFIGSLRLG
jgi:hypothetical protein